MGRVFGYVMIALVALLLAGVGSWGFRVVVAEWKGRGDAHITIQSGSNRIAQYEHFFDLCVSVQNAEAAIDAESARLASATSDKNKEIIETNISALHSTRMRGINQYNADAKKDYTDGQFLASNLPYELSTAFYEGSNKTRCAR